MRERERDRERQRETERDRERLKNYLRRHGLGAWRLSTSSQIGIPCGESAAIGWEERFSVECVIAWSVSVSRRVGNLRCVRYVKRANN